MSRAYVVGTAGHVDHGKTALVRALTGVETDRWREERERGLTIDLGFAPLEVEGDAEVGVVDVPGHEDFVTNMLAGATGLDLLLLVVAADEGPMPQTREHLAIASLLGVPAGVVALTKVDRVEEAWLELAIEATREELRRVPGFEDWPVVPVSSTEGTGLEVLRAAIAERATGLRDRPEEDLFRLPVDRSFTVRGAGTVVTGTVWSGAVAVDREVRLLPGDRRARVRSLQVHGADRKRVAAGRRCALALVGVDPEEVGRGTTVVRGDVWRAVDRLGAMVHRLEGAGRPLEDGQRVRVFLGTDEVMARLELPGEALAAGVRSPALLRLEAPLVARVGDRFVLRFYSPVTTVGGGTVAELEPPRRWRERGDAWREIVGGGPRDVLRRAVELRGGEGLAMEEAPLVTGLSLDSCRELANRPPAGLLPLGGRWFGREVLEALLRRLPETVAAMHRRHRRASLLSLEALRNAVGGRYAPELVERALGDLREAGELVVEGPGVRLPGHRPVLTPEEERALETIVRRVEEGGIEPPTVAELGEELGLGDGVLHDLLALGEERGELARITPDLYLAPAGVRSLVGRAREVMRRHRPAEASHFKEAFGVTRRYLIPLLEHLDRSGVSRRTPAGRIAAGGETASPDGQAGPAAGEEDR